MIEHSAQQRSRLISSEILLGCSQAAQQLGIDIMPTLKEHQIKPAYLQSPEGFLSHYQVINFLEDVAERFNCQHFGFLVGKYQPPLRIGTLSQLLKLSPNLYSALENGMLYGGLYSELSKHQLTIENEYVNFIRWDRTPYQGTAIQLHTLGVVQIFKTLKALCGNSWRATSVYFSHSGPSEQQQYIRFFECSVCFDREFDGIIFPKNDLYKSIKTADPELLKIVRAYLDGHVLEKGLEQDDIVTNVRHYIRQKLGTNLCNIESCAQHFHLHTRTLQRLLSDNNCAFKQLLLEARMSVAEHYLTNSELSIIGLTDILGYKNPSAFVRAFKNTYGISPSQWREQLIS